MARGSARGGGMVTGQIDTSIRNELDNFIVEEFRGFTDFKSMKSYVLI